MTLWILTGPQKLNIFDEPTGLTKELLLLNITSLIFIAPRMLSKLFSISYFALILQFGPK